MPKSATILAIETATSNCSVALQYQGNVIARAQDGNNVHSQVLLSMVSEVLDEAGVARSQIDAVAVGQGPGSFTGLRIGVGVAQGIAYGVACPMIGVSSLDALANMASSSAEPFTVLAGIDARMNEIYWCEYECIAGSIKRTTELMVTPPQAVIAQSNSALQLVGNAWAEYTDRLDPMIQAAIGEGNQYRYPTAEAVLQLAVATFAKGELTSPIDFAPEYVRNDVAKKSNKTFGKT